MSMQCAAMLYYIDILWSYWNNLLLQNFLELGKISVSKVHCKLWMVSSKSFENLLSELAIGSVNPGDPSHW